MSALALKPAVARKKSRRVSFAIGFFLSENG
jgi:hypothetical protein